MTLAAQLQSVRAEARVAFEQHCTNVRARLRYARPKALPRENFPGLEEIILLHRCRHAAARAFERKRFNRYSCAEKLGDGELRDGDIWKARLERVSFVCVEQTRRTRVKCNQKTIADTPKLPQWLCQIRATKYATFMEMMKKKVEMKDVDTTEKPVLSIKPIAPLTDTRGYAQYIARVSGLLAENITSTAKTATIIDVASTIIKRYAGKPDELYRRRHGRAFARWRRQKREADEIARAEAEMARRRGTDRLHTQRQSDADAKVFEFDGGEHAYAYNTRITEAPRLRAQMVRKYASPAPQPLVPRLQGREKALQFADSAPMFHTRVMDRFRR